MSVIASGDNNQGINKIITNNGFYPDLETAELREQYNIDTTIADKVLEKTLKLSILYINNQLKKWKKCKTDLGITQLDQIESETYGTEKEIVTDYKVAVYSLSKAKVIEQWRDFDSTKSGHKEAEEIEEKVNEYKSDSQRAIRKINKNQWAGLI